MLRYDREIRWLYQAAMVVFLVTIGLGMARGLGLIDFDDRNLALTHLHSGVLGWITLGVFATALWLYGSQEPRQGDERFIARTSILVVLAVPIYVLAWWTGNLPFRALAGTLLLVAIVLFVVWLVIAAVRIGYARLTTPRLGVVVGLVALVVGSTLGVLLQVSFATQTTLVPGEGVGAHAETQIQAYLLVIGMSLAYWRLHGDDRTRRGTWMVWLILVGGAITALAALANVLPASILYIPLDIAAFVIFLSLTWERVLRPGWMTANSTRHYALAVPFAIVYLAVFIYLILGLTALGLWTDFSQIPPTLIPAAEHPLFLGMFTNILFGLLFDLNRDRRSIWPWADGVVFWGLNLAVAAFTITLIVGAEGPLPIITPILGLSILLGLATHTRRLWTASAPAMAV